MHTAALIDYTKKQDIVWRQNYMRDEKDCFEKIQSELEEGMSLDKCRKCGCMKQV
jgi:hypothetical protein